MQHATLLTELASRNIELSINANGTLKCTGPKDAITPDILTALKEHRAALIAELATPSSIDSGTGNTEPLPVVTPAPRRSGYRPTHDEVQTWERYYSSCAWYKDKNIWKDNPFSLALPYACFDNIGTCVQWVTSDLIQYYASCKPRSLTTGPDSVQEVEPRSFTQMLRTAYQFRNVERIRALASNFHSVPGVETILARLEGKYTEQQPEPEPDTEPLPVVAPSSKSKRQWVTVFADIDAGRAITEQGTLINFPARCSLATFIQAVQSETSISRVYLCGNRPGETSEQFIQWLASPEMLTEYTTDAKGHYLDVRKPDASVARYEHRLTREKIDIRRITSWLGDSTSTDEQEPRYTIEDARDTLTLATRYIRQYFHKEMNLSGTPGATFKRLWTEGNRIAGKKFAVLPDEVRTLIHENAGQGRIEFFSDNSTGKLPGLFYYDGIFMYAALTWGMPTELATHDNLNEYAGKVPARYRIQFTVPANWQHVGLFMTRKENGWFYPGVNEAGNTYETWVDGSELDIAFNLPQGMPTWDITILERIVFKPETASGIAKPLNTITEKLVKIREHIARDARQDASRAHVYKLASGIIRNILLHGIGSFNRQNSERSYVLLDTEPAPANYTDYEEIDEHTRWYKVSTEQVGDTSMMHPEYAALIWARCRARMTKAALSLPYGDVIAIRTDAIAVKHLVTQWENNTANGKLRRKWAIEKSLQAPKNDEQLDNIQRKAAHK